MSKRTDYTDSEWKALCDVPMMSAGYIVAADFSVTSFVSELKAAITFVQKAKDAYKGVELVEAIVEAYQNKEVPTGELPPEEKMLGAITEAVAIVERKSPGEAPRFKEFVYKIADVVANAAGEGWFGRGPKVSEAEKRGLEKIKQALRL